MPDSNADSGSVKTGAVLLNPASMAVLWSNDASTQSTSPATVSSLAGPSLDALLPMAEQLGLAEAVSEVANTGKPKHLRADVVSMTRGSIAYVVSVYRLPDGMVLILAEHAWQIGERPPRDGLSRAGRRKAR